MKKWNDENGEEIEKWKTHFFGWEEKWEDEKWRKYKLNDMSLLKKNCAQLKKKKTTKKIIPPSLLKQK